MEAAAVGQVSRKWEERLLNNTTVYVWWGLSYVACCGYSVLIKISWNDQLIKRWGNVQGSKVLLIVKWCVYRWFHFVRQLQYCRSPLLLLTVVNNSTIIQYYIVAPILAMSCDEPQYQARDVMWFSTVTLVKMRYRIRGSFYFLQSIDVAHGSNRASIQGMRFNIPHQGDKISTVGLWTSIHDSLDSERGSSLRSSRIINNQTRWLVKVISGLMCGFERVCPSNKMHPLLQYHTNT